MAWRLPWTWLRQALTSIDDRVVEIDTRTQRMEKTLVDTTQLLTEVAEGLRGPLATSITALLAERDGLAAQVASLNGEDVTESAAAQDVRAAFDEVARKFTVTPAAPDVEPLPPAGDTPPSVDPSAPADTAGGETTTEDDPGF